MFVCAFYSKAGKNRQGLLSTVSVSSSGPCLIGDRTKEERGEMLTNSLVCRNKNYRFFCVWQTTLNGGFILTAVDTADSTKDLRFHLYAFGK